MKFVKLFEDFRPDSVFYTYKEDTGGGRAMWVLKLESEAWEKVKDLFTKGESEKLTYADGRGHSWSLRALEYSSQNLRTHRVRHIHKIYGVCGDYTFGNAPSFHNQAFRSNKKSAKVVFDKFIEEHLKDLDEWMHAHRGTLKGKKFGL